MIVLDTCTVLWLASGSGLPPAVLARITATDAVFVSAMSALEIGIKVARGKLVLPLPPERWWPRVLEHHGLAEVPIDGEIALRSASLPRLHADPADRVMVATAQHLRAALLTPDPLISAYPGVDVWWK